MPLLTPKVPPHSEEAEQSVLGALMTDSRCHVEVLPRLRAEDFYFEKHRLIFGAIQTLNDAARPCDLVTVSDILRSNNQLASVDGLPYLGQLVTDNPGSANPMVYAQIVRERAALRGIIAAGDAMVSAAFNTEGRSVADLLSEAETSIERIRNGSQTTNTAQKFAHWDALHAHYEEASAARRAGGTLGVPTSIAELDSVIGGFKRKRFYGIAAPPGSGKSALLNQFAVHAAKNGRKGLVITAEMTALELQQRALASESGVNLYHIINGFEDSYSRVHAAAERIGDIPLWIDGDINTLSGAVAQMALHKARYGIEWAAIDHIGLMETPKFNSRNDQVGFITRTLKKEAKRLDIAVIGLMQLNRNSEKDNRRPRLHDLRDSGNIEQDLDVAIFLHTLFEHRQEKQKPLQIGVLKNRSGMSAWLESQFLFDGSTQRIQEHAALAPNRPQEAFHDEWGYPTT